MLLPCRPSLLLLLALACLAPSAPASPPNIILILTDDLGYGDLSSFGQSRFTTPGLDRLAAEGARLTHHYAAAPVCAPSRASLLLGVHQGHANVRDNQFDKALEDNHTLATVLHRAGYATAAIGKWGLHGQPVGGGPTGPDPHAPAHPLNRGFDSFYGMLRHIDGHEHYPKEAPYFAAKAKARGAVRVWDNRSDVTAGLDKCYTTDLFTARAKKFIVEHARGAPRQPFFLYLAYDTPHAVLELPTQAYPAGGGLQGGLQWLGEPGHMINTASGQIDSWTDPATTGFSQPWPDAYRRQATSVRRIDNAVADLVRLLADLGIDDNTLVVFTSDNGPEKESMLDEPFTPEFFRSYGPFDGIKRDLWEGGSRVPTFVRWPGRIPPTRVIATPSAQWDWLPTFADAAGLPAPARADGISLLPALTGRRTTQARASLYFEYNVAGKTPAYTDFEPAHRNRPRNQMQAIRLGDLVGVRYDIKAPGDPFEIYDITTDPKEKKNLAGDPGYAIVQSRLQAIALQSRRPDTTAPRPYDEMPVPALDQMAAAPPAGIAWQTYAGDFPWVPNFEAMTASASGRMPRPDAGARELAGASGVLFTGCLEVPGAGDYTFFLTADAGAEFRLHEATVIDADFGYTGGTERSGTIRLAAGVHPFRLSYRRGGSAAPGLKLEWSGPGGSRQPIPDSAWRGPVALASSAAVSQLRAAPGDFPPHPDSVPNPAVPKGDLIPFDFASPHLFPGTTRSVTLYVPKQYDPARPACVFVNQDNVQWNAPVVFDNLIARGEIPVLVGVFVRPGVVRTADSRTAYDRLNRSYEYDGLGDGYARFLLEELLPAVETRSTPDGRPIRLSHSGADRAIGGSSSGAIAAWTAAWERPDAFTRVFSNVGTYVGLRGGDTYATLVRKYEPKPLRVFLVDGANDLNIYAGDWWMANQTMERALTFAGYDVRHVWGEGGHNQKHGAAAFPEAIRWLWKGWPAPVQPAAPTQNAALTELLIPGEEWQAVTGAAGKSSGVTADNRGEVHFPAESGRMTFGPDGTRYTLGAHRVLARDATGRETILAGDIAGHDLVAAHNGNLYVTEPSENPAKDAGKLWLLRPGHAPRAVDTGFRGISGVTLSPDQTLLYAADGRSHWVISYVIQPDGSLAYRQRFFWLHKADADDHSFADGLAVDRDGRLYVATRLGIQICDSAGRVNAILPLPAGRVTSLTFGGPAFDTLYAACGDRIFRRKLKITGAPAWAGPHKPAFSRP